MATRDFNVLTINGGSSSIKFSVYSCSKKLALQLSGRIERIGTSDPVFTYTIVAKDPIRAIIKAKDIKEAGLFLISWLNNQLGIKNIDAAGHRIVYGMKHTNPVYIDEQLLDELKQSSRYDPDHMPGAISLIENIREQYPLLKQIACFDTAFHSTLPRVASMYALPRKFEAEGIRRYGFHGLSYQYLLKELEELTNKKIYNGKLILAHLGSGASMAAVNKGICLDTTMGFTPAGGFMMGTRSGDLDPGIISYLFQQDKFSAKQLDDLINHQSGLLGVSQTSSDMHDLLKTAQTDIRAEEAISLFCYQVKKSFCAFTGVLGGADALVFTGGIGENAYEVRARICGGLEYLGLQLDEKQNRQQAFLISSVESRIAVYVIAANEEYMIAQLTNELIN
jgi:acetate kinase